MEPGTVKDKELWMTKDELREFIENLPEGVLLEIKWKREAVGDE